MKKIIGFFLLVLSAGFSSTTAFADTLKLVSTTGPSVGGESIFPYNFSINGSTDLVSLLCVNLDRSVSVGESWTATKNSIPTDGSALSIEYRALALIDYGLLFNIGSYSAGDYQYAAWSIFDFSAMAGNSGYTANAATIRNTALALAAGSTVDASFYSSFYYYAPTSDTTGWTNGIPQQFFGYTEGSNPNSLPPALVPAPEPSSLLLLGTGVIGVAATIRKRIARVA